MGMLYTGSFASPQDRAKPRIIKRNGLKVGFLAYTYGTNGIPVPVSQENTYTPVEVVDYLD